MTMMPVFEKQFGGNTFRVHTSKITPSKMDEIAKAIGEIRGSRSIYNRIPAETGELHEKYIERASLQDPELIKKEDETTEEHAARVMRPKIEVRELGFLIINGLAPLFEQEQVSKGAYDSCPWLPTRDFIYNVLNYAECPAGDFSPKSIVK